VIPGQAGLWTAYRPVGRAGRADKGEGLGRPRPYSVGLQGLWGL
jgi:hypothetical protein